MHEASIALEVRSICERETTKLPESRTRSVSVEVGAFSGIEVETLRSWLGGDGGVVDGLRFQVTRESAVAICPRMWLQVRG